VIRIDMQFWSKTRVLRIRHRDRDSANPHFAKNTIFWQNIVPFAMSFVLALF
jgi:hypothetical protein